MKQFWTGAQVALSTVGGAISYFFGGFDGLMIALVIFAVCDYIAGLFCAISSKTLSSAVGFRGICKKVLMFALVGVGHIVDAHVIGSGSALRTAVLVFYLSNEGVSILENASRLGLPVPQKLRDILAQLHDHDGK